MPFSIRPFRRFPVQCSGPYHAGLFLTLQPAYFLSFGSVVTLLVLGHGLAYGEWVSVSGNVGERLTASTVYVDPDTIRRDGEVVKLWGLMDFKTIQTEPSPPHLSVKSQREFDCVEERVRLLALTVFSGHLGSGNAVYSYTDSKDQVIAVEPDSVA